MKAIIILTVLSLFSLSVSAQKLPDTSKAPKIYWSELIRLQSLNNELARRYHKERMDALKRDTLDMYTSEIGYLTPLVYRRTYPDTTKKK